MPASYRFTALSCVEFPTVFLSLVQPPMSVFTEGCHGVNAEDATHWITQEYCSIPSKSHARSPVSKSEELLSFTPWVPSSADVKDAWSTVPCLWASVAGLRPRSPGFCPNLCEICVARSGCSGCTLFSRCQFHCTIAPYSCSIRPPTTLYNVRN